VTAQDQDHVQADPLMVARSWAASAIGIAMHYERRHREDPRMAGIESAIDGAGKAQFEACQNAAYLALVSIASDIRALTDHIARGASAAAFAERYQTDEATWAQAQQDQQEEQ
jgi:hypothetical protein